MRRARAAIGLLAFFILAARGTGADSSCRPENLVLHSGIEALIDDLVAVDEPGFGYAATLDGTEFLPLPGSATLNHAVLGEAGPRRSTTLTAIVRSGAAAIDALIAHLNDDRETRLPVAKGMSFTFAGGEFDFNPRTRTDRPRGVNQDTSDNHADGHRITVGDLCFVALGQIVNRSFVAVRYAPTGGVVFNSPTHSRRLREAATLDFQGFGEEELRAHLVRDFTRPDTPERRIGSYRRLCVYFPDEVEPLVVKQLTVPCYDYILAREFVWNVLADEPRESRRRELFALFIDHNGPPARDGIRNVLVDELAAAGQESDGVELTRKGKARRLLRELYGFDGNIGPEGCPDSEYWSSIGKSGFVGALVHDDRQGIDDCLLDLLFIEKDQMVALAYISRLRRRGYEQRIRPFLSLRLRIEEW